MIKRKKLIRKLRVNMDRKELVFIPNPTPAIKLSNDKEMDNSINSFIERVLEESKSIVWAFSGDLKTYKIV